MIKTARTPIAVRLLLTSACNLRCCYCLADADRTPAADELETNEWIALFDELAANKVFDVTISGGEPFLRNDAMALLEHLARSRKHRITVLTNGTLIDRQIADQLVLSGIRNLWVTIDGPEATHDRLRGHGTFAEAVRGIQHLVNAGARVGASFTTTKVNFATLGDTIDLLVEQGVTSMTVNALTPEGRCSHIFKDLAIDFPTEAGCVAESLSEKRAQYPKFKIECQFTGYCFFPDFLRNQLESGRPVGPQHLKSGCGAATTSCVVTATGEIIPCEGFTQFSAGNIRTEGLLDAWRAPGSFSQIRALNERRMDTLPFCGDCRYNVLCDGGCRALAYEVRRDLLAPGIMCPVMGGWLTR